MSVATKNKKPDEQYISRSARYLKMLERIKNAKIKRHKIRLERTFMKFQKVYSDLIPNGYAIEKRFCCIPSDGAAFFDFVMTKSWGKVIEVCNRWCLFIKGPGRLTDDIRTVITSFWQCNALSRTCYLLMPEYLEAFEEGKKLLNCIKKEVACKNV